MLWTWVYRCFFPHYKRLLCGLFFISMSGSLVYAEDEQLTINDQTFLVYRRYYFIARLNKTIKLLAKFAQSPRSLLHGHDYDVIDELLRVPEMQQFHHILIQDSVHSIERQRSLKPLFMVWDSFKAYKSLKDDLFIEDFSKEIFIITRTIAQHLHPEQQLKSLPIDTNVVCRCDAISRLTEYIEQCIDEGKTHQFITLPERSAGDVSDLALTIHTDEVALRYYILHRLEDAADFMLQLPATTVQDIHQTVISLTRAHRHKGLRKRTFAQIWDDCKQYKFIDDITFVHAFAVELSVMFQIYQEQAKSVRHNQHLNYGQFMQIYQQVNKMPLEDILNSIDFFVTHAMAISNNYKKSGLSFGQWAAKYWWAPPMVIATIIVQCVKFYYKKFYPR